MTVIIILIKPDKEKVCVGVDDAYFQRIVSVIKKIRGKRNNFSFKIPENGFYGMLLINNETKKIYVYHDKIFFFNNNVIEVYTDSRKKIHGLLLKKALKQHYEKLKYYFEVSNIGSNDSQILLK
jgi:hypothetical protein